MVNETSDRKGYQDEPMVWEKWLAEYSELVDKTHQFFSLSPSHFHGKHHEETYQHLITVLQRYALLWEHLLQDPEKMFKAQYHLSLAMLEMGQKVNASILGHPNQEAASGAHKDKRFNAQAWDTNPMYVFIKQSYLATANYLRELTIDVKGLDPKVSAQVRFYTEQLINALSPTNFVMTNPEILEKTFQTGGTNLIKGFNNMLDDLRENAGHFHIKMTDYTAFEVGKNLAVTPGVVVYQNEMMQLIQYTPTTPKVGKVPLLIIPPWINKYYILDLQPANSFVKFAVDSGNTVFLISWANPDARYRNKGFPEYIEEGSLAALAQVEKMTQEKKTNIVSFCIGGTLTGMTAAYLAAKGQQDRISSITFLATLLDFSIPGDLGIFIDEDHLKNVDAQMEKKGYLDGRDMRMAFNLLRSNDLIWTYYVSHYLAGEDPFPFDLLYWNNDITNLPQKMHSFYLHEMYNHNRLVKPGGVSIHGTPLDLSKITIPTYFISTERDHIAQWQGTYKGAILLGGEKRFVLGGAGHTAGIINPPAKEKYGYRVNDMLPEDPEEWYNGGTQYSGSWWLDWIEWLKPYMGKMIPSRDPGKGIEPAPGSYVKVRLTGSLPPQESNNPQ